MESESKTTRIIVQTEADFRGVLYLRGEGAGLHKDRGVPLRRTLPTEWVFETTLPFSEGSFQIFLDDRLPEEGEGHSLYHGASIRVNPLFPSPPDRSR